MKTRLKRLLTITIVSTLFVSAPVFAQIAPTMTDAHIAAIKANCHATISTLGQIHANDAPDYINRNQTYFSISDKLMARLNSRLTFNRFNATQLVKTSSDYNDTLVKFRIDYKEYDDLMSEVINMNCQKEPVSFYDKVSDARDARQKVHDAADELTALITLYEQQVQTFQNQHFIGQVGTDNS